jgi:putative transcriptional regulator
MPPRKTIFMACATLTALTAAVQAGFEGSGAAGGQLRPDSVKELAAGKLLVAARGLPDSNFAEAVILLAEHSTESSMGLIINRRTDVSLARLFPKLKQAQGQTSELFVGGPVSPDGVLALLRSAAPQANSRRIFDDVYMLATREALEESIAARVEQTRFRVYLGYAGWGPGQLERETTQGAWHVFRADTAIVFDPDPDTLWQRQIRRTEERMARLRLPASARQAQPGSTRANLPQPDPTQPNPR